jgi:molybdopterin-guanine dinucleotide biosynthesis protein A
MRNATNDAVVILGGGKALRLPGKLERSFEGRPLLLHVYENVRSAGPVYISAKATFSIETDAALECPIVIDRWPGRGPVAGLVSTADVLREPRFFAVAGDAPGITTEVLSQLRAAWEDGDEAVVPQHDGQREPLAALYDREAFLREARILLRTGDASMHALLDRLRVRYVTMPAQSFVNINTAADWPTRNV